MTKKINSFHFQIFIVFILMIVLAWLFPYSGDDWAWGSVIGLDRLKNGFTNYNGRYMGNLIVLLLTRSNILKSIIMAITIVGISYGMMYFINKKNKKIFWFGLILTLLMPTNILAQGVVWTSGFTNYAIPTLFIIIYINIFKGVFTDDYYINKKYMIYTFALGLVNALFMENISTYNAVISLMLLIYTYIKFKKVDYVQLAFLLGTTLGLIIMFSNGAYTKIMNNEDSYRNIPQEGNIIIRSIQLYFDRFHQLFFFDNYMLNGVLTISLITYIHELLKKEHTKFINICLYISQGFFMLFFMYILITVLNPDWNIFLKYTKYFNGLLVVVFCLLVLFVTAVNMKNNEQMQKAFFLETSIVILTVPLFVVNPIGPRCFLPSYMLFVGLTGCFINQIKVFIPRCFLILSTVLCYLYLFNVYAVVYKYNVERIQYIRENINSSEVYVEKLPYESYVWTGNPKIKIWNERFKLFYDIPDCCEIIVKD